MPGQDDGRREGGIDVGGNMTVHGDAAGRDVIRGVSQRSLDPQVLAALLEPLGSLARRLPDPQRTQADAQATAIRRELERSEGPRDALLERLLGGFVELVPAGVAAVIAAFGNPLLGAVAGPATRALLARLGSKA